MERQGEDIRQAINWGKRGRKFWSGWLECGKEALIDRKLSKVMVCDTCQLNKSEKEGGVSI